jgi:hypothetical protein
MDVVTDSAVSMAEARTPLSAPVSTAITTPVKKVSGAASGISHGLAALRARRDVGEAVSVSEGGGRTAGDGDRRGAPRRGPAGRGHDATGGLSGRFGP